MQNQSNFSENNKIVQSNSLIQQTNWKLNFIPLKILKTLVSCIDTSNPPSDNMVIISKKELYDILGTESFGSYSYLKKQIKSLQSAIVEIKTERGSITTSLVPTVYWYDDSSYVKVKFSEELMPYLLDLKERFTQYPLINIKSFKSKYAIIIYEYLLSRARSEKSTKFYVSIEDLRYLTDSLKKYSKFKDFEAYVLKPAIENINNGNLEFLVRYDKIKEKTKITKICFYVRARTSYKENDFFKVENNHNLNIF